MEFVFCTVSSCPLNVDNQCRSKFINVGMDGSCLTCSAETKPESSETPRHVEIRSCLCGQCDHWESDANGNPLCGFADSLSFEGRPTEEVPDRKKARKEGKPMCSVFLKKVDQPDWSTTMPE